MSLSMIVGATIFFKVETISVEGNSHYTAEEIVSATGILLGSNLFRIPREEISQNITYALPYVQAITVKLTLPTEIRLVVEEQKGMVKLETEDGSWYMGVQGKLLEKIEENSLPFVEATEGYEESWAETWGNLDEMPPQVEGEVAGIQDYQLAPVSYTTIVSQEEVEAIQDSTMEIEGLFPPLLDWENSDPNLSLDFDPEEPVITVTGIEPVDPQPGQLIQVSEEDNKQLVALLQLFKELENYELFQEVTNIHVHIYQHFEFNYEDRFLVKFPFTTDYSYKLRALTSAVSNTEHYETGIMDLTQEHYAVLFTPD